MDTRLILTLLKTCILLHEHLGKTLEAIYAEVLEHAQRA